MTRKAVVAPVVPPSERLAFRAKEVAVLLGISERKLRDIQHALPHVAVGGVILFPRAALESWLAQQVTAENERLNVAVDEVLRTLVPGGDEAQR